MGLSEDHVKGAIRLSWCHLTPKVDWDAVVGLCTSHKQIGALLLIADTYEINEILGEI
jgi:hypothetical protein